jgi:putative heme degradation protein
MNYEQPKVFGVRTSVNKVYLKNKAASNSYSKLLEGFRAYDELQIVVTEDGQVKQTVTTCALIVSSKFV